MVGPDGSARRLRSQRATSPRRERRPSQPVVSSNMLGDLPLSLRRLATRTGDVRKVRRIGPAAVELDIEDARALGLVQ